MDENTNTAPEAEAPVEPVAEETPAEAEVSEGDEVATPAPSDEE